MSKFLHTSLPGPHPPSENMTNFFLFIFFLTFSFEQREVSKSIAVQVTVCQGKLDSGDRLLKLSPFDSSVECTARHSTFDHRHTTFEENELGTTCTLNVVCIPC